MNFMKIIIFTGLFLLVDSFCEAKGQLIQAQDFKGQVWEYSEYIYRNQRLPRPNPNLHVRFEFVSESLLDLIWFRDQDEEHCRRTSQYIWENNFLMQKIIWVDPTNSIGCSNDPDMQLNRESVNKLEFTNQELFLHLELNGEDFIYILKQI